MKHYSQRTYETYETYERTYVSSITGFVWFMVTAEVRLSKQKELEKLWNDGYEIGASN